MAAVWDVCSLSLAVPPHFSARIPNPLRHIILYVEGSSVDSTQIEVWKEKQYKVVMTTVLSDHCSSTTVDQNQRGDISVEYRKKNCTVHQHFAPDKPLFIGISHFQLMNLNMISTSPYRSLWLGIRTTVLRLILPIFWWIVAAAISYCKSAKITSRISTKCHYSRWQWNVAWRHGMPYLSMRRTVYWHRRVNIVP